MVNLSHESNISTLKGTVLSYLNQFLGHIFISKCSELVRLRIYCEGKFENHFNIEVTVISFCAICKNERLFQKGFHLKIA